MSFIDDNPWVMDYPEEYQPEGADNMAVWVDREENQIPIHQLETSHLENIIRGGARWWGQDEKLPALTKELELRNRGTNNH